MSHNVNNETSEHDDDSKLSRKMILKDAEISVPIVYGTMAFWLGKKATEYQSHKWTVYVRGPSNEDLGVVIKRVVFQLHPSFNNPTRVVESPPFELSECGWGEFQIAISLYFHDHVCDRQLDLYHNLKLYPEGEPGPQTIKKPVVVETYDEIVFPSPTEFFCASVQNHPAVILSGPLAKLTLPAAVIIGNKNETKKRDTKDHPSNNWFVNFSEADELLKLAAARQQVTALQLRNQPTRLRLNKSNIEPLPQVQAHIMKMRRQLSVIEAVPQQLKPTSES